MSPQLQEFIVFPNLPFVLRRKVYRYAAFSPRNINIFDINLNFAIISAERDSQTTSSNLLERMPAQTI